MAQSTYFRSIPKTNINNDYFYQGNEVTGRDTPVFREILTSQFLALYFTYEALICNNNVSYVAWLIGIVGLFVARLDFYKLDPL